MTMSTTQALWKNFLGPSPRITSYNVCYTKLLRHNGNVVNNIELRQQFIDEGLTVRSQNDGETCVHAVERYLNRGYEFIDAIRLAYGDLEGDYSYNFV